MRPTFPLFHHGRIHPETAMTRITVSRGAVLWVGDRISIDGQTNRKRPVISRRISDTEVEVAIFVRWSLGFSEMKNPGAVVAAAGAI